MFFLLSLLPILIWGIHWFLNKNIDWREAATGVGACLLTALLFQAISGTDAFVPTDVETRSGQVAYGQYQPRWKEFYEEAIYRNETYVCGSDSKTGAVRTCTRRVFSHYEDRTRWHDAQWWVTSSLGTFGVSQERYADIRKEFGAVTSVAGDRTTGEHNSRMIEGTKFDERTVNATEYVYPVTDNTHFKNKLLKAKGSLYEFTQPSAEEEASMFAWPEKQDRFDTNRLLGTANQVWSRREWDQLNATLGPAKRVNLIAIGFPSGTGMEIGMRQEAYWHGGKKNDLVLAFGGDPQKPEWAYVFGWTEKQAVKRLLENRLRDGQATTAEIYSLVVAEYDLAKFEERFEHIKISPPGWFYVIFFVVMAVSQATAHFFFTNNNDTTSYRYGLRRNHVGWFNRRD